MWISIADFHSTLGAGDIGGFRTLLDQVAYGPQSWPIRRFARFSRIRTR